MISGLWSTSFFVTMVWWAHRMVNTRHPFLCFLGWWAHRLVNTNIWQVRIPPCKYIWTGDHTVHFRLRHRNFMLMLSLQPVVPLVCFQVELVITPFPLDFGTNFHVDAFSPARCASRVFEWIGLVLTPSFPCPMFFFGNRIIGNEVD